MWSGLPAFSLPIMRRTNWVSKACHFIPGIRSAHGISNFWIRSDEVSSAARAEALQKTTSVLHCVTYSPHESADDDLWRLTSAGLVTPASLIPLSPGLRPLALKTDSDFPSARDFLLFAVTDYHVFRVWEVNVYRGNVLLFSTKGMPPSSVVDVDDEELAVAIVAAQMVRRPYSQTYLRDRAKLEGPTDAGPYRLDLDSGIDLDTPICAIDVHSYSPEASKVSASLRELAGAYCRIVRHIKNTADAPQWLVTGQIAEVSVGQTLWAAVLGGALLDAGRLTIQNLPGRWAVRGQSADEIYLSRVEAVLQLLEPYANTPQFYDLVFSGGTSRRGTYPFFAAGIAGQMVICYFLSVGTTAGVWTSVAMSNALYVGKLTDWDSIYYGKTDATSEPGFKMYVPESPSKELLAVATFDRSSPRRGPLRPGFVLNLFGLIAAVLGAIFAGPTRAALGFGESSATPDWVVYTCAGLCAGTSLLVLVSVALQQTKERTWLDASEAPTRFAVCATLAASFAAAALGVLAVRCRLARLWPVLDALAWVAGLPLGVLENGRMIAIDDNLLHLVLLNRWMLGALASSVGSSAANAAGVCAR
jgi:hypothetical protein